MMWKKTGSVTNELKMASQRSRCAALDPWRMGQDFSLVPTSFSSSFRRSLAKSLSDSCLNVNFLPKECNPEVFAKQSCVKWFMSQRKLPAQRMQPWSICQAIFFQSPLLLPPFCMLVPNSRMHWKGAIDQTIQRSWQQICNSLFKTLNAFKVITAITPALVTPMNVKSCLFL